METGSHMREATHWCLNAIFEADQSGCDSMPNCYIPNCHLPAGDGQHPCSRPTEHCGVFHFDALFYKYCKRMGWPFGDREKTYCDEFMRLHFKTGSHDSSYAHGLEFAPPICTKETAKSYERVLNRASFEEFKML